MAYCWREKGKGGGCGKGLTADSRGSHSSKTQLTPVVALQPVTGDSCRFGSLGIGILGLLEIRRGSRLEER